PDTVEQLLAGKYSARPLHEELEQTIFGRTKLDLAAGARHALLLAIELDVAVAQHVGDAFGARTPQQGTHPRDQLRHGKRLDDVVVGAGGKPPHALALLAAGGEHDDRQRLAFRARAQTP